MATYNISVLSTSSSGNGYRFSGTDKDGTISSSTNNPTINITAGDTINFTFSNGTSHPFTINGTTIDGESATGGSYSTPTSESYTFSSTMTYTYFCEVHGSMTGSIIASAASATTTTTTTTAAPTTTTTTTTTTLAPGETTTTTTTTTSAPSATTTTTTTTTAPPAATTTTTTTAAPDGTATTTTTTTTTVPDGTATTTTTTPPNGVVALNNDWQLYYIKSLSYIGFPASFFHFYKYRGGINNLQISDVEFEYRKEGETTWATKYFHYSSHARYIQLPSETIPEENKPKSLGGNLHGMAEVAITDIGLARLSTYEFRSQAKATVLYLKSLETLDRDFDARVGGYQVSSDGKHMIRVLDMPNWDVEFSPVFYKSKSVSLDLRLNADGDGFYEVAGALRDPTLGNVPSTAHRYGPFSGSIPPLAIDIPSEDYGGVDNITYLNASATYNDNAKIVRGENNFISDNKFGTMSLAGGIAHNVKLSVNIGGNYSQVSWSVPEDKQIIFDYSNSNYWRNVGISDDRNGWQNNDTYDLFGYEIEVKAENESEWKDWIVLNPDSNPSDMGFLWGSSDTGGDEYATCLKGRDGKEYEAGSTISLIITSRYAQGNVRQPGDAVVNSPFREASDADVAANPDKYEHKIGERKFRKSYVYDLRVRAVYKCDFFEGSSTGGSVLPDGSVVGLPVATPTFCTSDWTEVKGSVNNLQLTFSDYLAYGEAQVANYDGESTVGLNNDELESDIFVSSILGPTPDMPEYGEAINNTAAGEMSGGVMPDGPTYSAH